MTAAPLTSARELIALLESSRQPGPAALAFDADGTLWSGDVGEDTFESACRDGILKEAGHEAMAHVARDHGLASDGSPSDLAARLYGGYRRGLVGERLMCEVMTYCYAGFTEDALHELAHRYLNARGLPDRARPVLVEVIGWARAAGLRVVVISASPAVIVREGLRLAGIEVDALGAAAAAASGPERLIEARMAEPVPYGPQKVVVGRGLLEKSDWLGAFGDNAFDVDMLKAARVRVAVSPKPALVARLGEVPGVHALS